MSRTYQALRRAEVERRSGASPNGRAAAWDDAAVPAIPFAASVEYERLRMWITNAAVRGERQQVILVTACRGGTGSTTTASLLATALAQGPHTRVLVVDGNFRTPSVSRVFAVEDGDGVSDTAAGGGIELRIQGTSRKNLQVITSRGLGTCPAEFFEGDTIEKFVGELRQRFDFVVIDAAPVLEFPDACAFAPRVDSVILVASADETSIEDAQRARQLVENAGGRILGAVLNRQREYVPRVLKRFWGGV